MEQLVHKISRQLRLNKIETDLLLHDINNLRGEEWLSEIEANCSQDIVKTFKKLIKAKEE